MTPNWELLRKCWNWLEEHPERWNQNRYVYTPLTAPVTEDPLDSCGTTFCLAGIALALSGKIFRDEYDEEGTPTLYSYDTREGNFLNPGAEVLGLTHRQAGIIFLHYPRDWQEMGLPKYREWVYKVLTNEDFYISLQLRLNRSEIERFSGELVPVQEYLAARAAR